MNINDQIITLMREFLKKYPPILNIATVAEILKQNEPALRARIRRHKFQVTVRQEAGGYQYVLLADLVRFLVTGEIQSQPESRPFFEPRNPRGFSRKRNQGRLKKSSCTARGNGGYQDGSL